MKSSRAILLLSSALLLASCGEATPEASSSSSNTPEISSSSDSPAPEPSPSSSSSGGQAEDSASSSPDQDKELIKNADIRKASKALGEAFDAMKETDSIGLSSSGGSGSLALQTGDKTISVPSADSSSEADHTFSDSASFSYSDLTLAGGVKGTKSGDVSSMKGFLAMGASLQYGISATVDGESQEKSGQASETAFAYLQDDHLYLDGTGLKDADGDALLTDPKVQYCVSETLDYLKEKADEIQSSLSSSFSYPAFSFDSSSWTGASVVASLNLISSKKTYYLQASGDYRADYVVSYDSVYSLLEAFGERNEDVAKALAYLPNPENVDLEQSLLQFVYCPTEVKKVSTAFKGTVQEEGYTANFAFENSFALSSGEAVAILEPSDPSSYVDKTPKSEEEGA